MATRAKKTVKRAAAKVPKAAPKLDLSNPKDRAVLDVLALAMSADGLVTSDETTFAVESMQRLLGLKHAGGAIRAQLCALITASVANIQAKGRDPVFEHALAQLESDAERRTLFALAASMVCVDVGVVEPEEARFLAQLRRALGLDEAEGLQAMAGVAKLMARRR